MSISRSAERACTCRDERRDAASCRCRAVSASSPHLRPHLVAGAIRSSRGEHAKLWLLRRFTFVDQSPAGAHRGELHSTSSPRVMAGDAGWNSIDRQYQRSISSRFVSRAPFATARSHDLSHSDGRKGRSGRHHRIMGRRFTFLINGRRLRLTSASAAVEREDFRTQLPPLPPGRIDCSPTRRMRVDSRRRLDRITVPDVEARPLADPTTSWSTKPDPRLSFVPRCRLGESRCGPHIAVAAARRTYIGMLGHAVVVSRDFTVFAPRASDGNDSMTSQIKFPSAMVRSRPLRTTWSCILRRYNSRSPSRSPPLWRRAQTRINGDVVTALPTSTHR